MSFLLVQHQSLRCGTLVRSHLSELSVTSKLTSKHWILNVTSVRKFIHEGHLNVHRKTHIGEKEFKCGQCNKAFTRKVNLLSHQRNHAGVKEFKCDEFNKSFTRVGHLNTHKKIHTGEEDF